MAGKTKKVKKVEATVSKSISTTTVTTMTLTESDLSRMIARETDITEKELEGATFFVTAPTGGNCSGDDLEIDCDLRGLHVRIVMRETKEE